jgi:excisionase family DNA binding protein
MPRQDPNEEIGGGEAARLLGVTRQHVSRLALDGKLPGRQVLGRYWVFRRGDVLAYKRADKSKGGRPKRPALAGPRLARAA